MYKSIENIQLVLPPPRRSDTYTAKFTSWPKPVARFARNSIFKLADKAVSNDMLSAHILIAQNEDNNLPDNSITDFKEGFYTKQCF